MTDPAAPADRYEVRTLAFLDVLGWKALIAASVEEPGLIAQMDCALASSDFVGKSGPPPSMQISVFSDHVCLSVGGAGPDQVANLCSYTKGVALNLLKQGFGFRGAIVEGHLVHRPNRIFGPALLEALHIESRVATYPRIVFSDATSYHLMMANNAAGGDLRIRDRDGLQFLDVVGWTDQGERCALIRKALIERWSSHPVDLAVRAKLGWLLKYLAAKDEDERAYTVGRRPIP